jgi:hypothetical protein
LGVDYIKGESEGGLGGLGEGEGALT